MEILFIGSIDFSRYCLDEILRLGGTVSAVITSAPEIAHRNSDFADLGETAGSHGIPIHRVRRLNDPENVSLIKELEPDVIFVFGFSQLISAEILSIPKLGCIGTHPALLPLNRGRHPIVWALVDGDQQGGLSFFYLEEGADTGDIVWQRSFPITLNDDASTLQEKCKVLASAAIADMLPLLERGTAPRIPQDHSLATYRGKRGEKDGEIDWSRPAVVSYNLVRALTRPYVGAHTVLAGQKIKVWRSHLLPDTAGASGSSAVPGEVLAEGPEGLMVQAGTGLLALTEWEAPDGLRPKIGDRFTGSSE